MHQAVRWQHVTLYCGGIYFFFLFVENKIPNKIFFFSCGFTAAAAFREKRCGAHLRATCLRAALRCQRMQMLALFVLC